MTNHPFFSIITCTLNSEKYITDTLESVDSQTFGDYEHIIVDGYSSDTTLAKIKKAKNNKRRIYPLQPNGISAAFNLGIEKARGKFLLFLNSDDALYDSSVLSAAHTFLEENQHLDWIYGLKCDIEHDGRIIGYFPTKLLFQQGSYFLLKYINFIPHQAVFMKREVFHKLGFFDVNLPYGMDYDFWLRVGNKTTWKFFNRVVCRYRVHAEARSTSLEAKTKTRPYKKLLRKRHMTYLELLTATVIDDFLTALNSMYR